MVSARRRKLVLGELIINREEEKDWENCSCGECKHYYMYYDNLDWECFGCDFNSKKINDPSDEACPYIKLRERR